MTKKNNKTPKGKKSKPLDINITVKANKSSDKEDPTDKKIKRTNSIIAIIVSITVIITFIVVLPKNVVDTIALFSTATPDVPIIFPVAKTGESLLIVADFEDRSGGKYSGVSAGQYIFDNLNDQIKTNNLNIRIEHLNSYITDSNVEKVLQAYQAKLIVWGWYDAISITVYIKANDSINTPSSLERVQTIIDPEKLQIQITEQVPQKTSYMTFFAIGLERYISGDYKSADSYFRKAEELKNYAQVDNLDLLYFYLGSTNMATANRTDALRYLELAIEYNSSPVSHFALGNVYYYLDQDFDSAIEEYDIALEKNDELIEVYLNRGAAFSDRGVVNSNSKDYKLAIEDFNKVIKQSKDNVVIAAAYYNRGNAYFRDNQFDLAKKDYDFVINNLSPDYAEAYNARALVFTNNKTKEDDTKALNDFNKAIELNPNFEDAYYNRGKFYGRSGDQISAISDFELLINIDSSNYEYYYYLALAAGQQWIKTNETQEEYYILALQSLNKCIEINGTFADAYLDRGSLYGMKHNFIDGVNDYSKVIALDPNNIKAYYFRGLAYMTYGYNVEAISDFQKVLQLNPDSSIRNPVQKYLAELQPSP